MPNGPDANVPEQEAGTGMAWYLAYTRPRLESVAELNLRQQGYDVYLPLYKVMRPRAVQASFEAMFPRYLLFRPQPGQSISAVRSTRGVSTIVHFGHEIAVVPQAVVQVIRAMEAARNDASADALGRFSAGQQVVVVDGPLRGLEALVVSASAQRVVILLALLGRMSRVGIKPDDLELRG